MNRHFFHSSCCRGAIVLAAALCLAAVTTADEATVIERHNARIMISAADGSPEIFEVDDELTVGESRQFFTAEGREIVVLRTEDGFDITVDGEPIDSHSTMSKIMITEDGEVSTVGGKQVKIVRLGEELEITDGADMKLIRVESGRVAVDGGDGQLEVIVLGGEGDADGERVWTGGDGAHVRTFTFGSSQTALEQLQSSGALDKLDAETREKVLDALRSVDE